MPTVVLKGHAIGFLKRAVVEPGLFGHVQRPLVQRLGPCGPEIQKPAVRDVQVDKL